MFRFRSRLPDIYIHIYIYTSRDAIAEDVHFICYRECNITQNMTYCLAVYIILSRLHLVTLEEEWLEINMMKWIALLLLLNGLYTKTDWFSIWYLLCMHAMFMFLLPLHWHPQPINFHVMIMNLRPVYWVQYLLYHPTNYLSHLADFWWIGDEITITFLASVVSKKFQREGKAPIRIGFILNKTLQTCKHKTCLSRSTTC